MHDNKIFFFSLADVPKGISSKCCICVGICCSPAPWCLIAQFVRQMHRAKMLLLYWRFRSAQNEATGIHAGAYNMNEDHFLNKILLLWFSTPMHFFFQSLTRIRLTRGNVTFFRISPITARILILDCNVGFVLICDTIMSFSVALCEEQAKTK